MKKLISILIIFVLLFSMVYSEEKIKDANEKDKEKKYWAEGSVEILDWKIKKDKVKIIFAMKNEKGNIAIKSYNIKFLIIYEGGIKDYHDYSCTSDWIEPYLQKIKKFEVPLKVNKEIEGIFVEELEYKTLEPEKYVPLRSMFLFSLLVTIVLWYALWPYLKQGL